MNNDTYICPRCKQNSELPEEMEDNSYRCPHCNKLIFFPIPGIEKGMNVGGFILEYNIGSGAMGDVWLAHQESMDRKIALKILSPTLTRDKHFISRFKKEVKITASFNHPNIVAAHDAGNDKGLHFLAMTYVKGLSLSDEIRVGGCFPEEKALKLIRDIASALQYLWNEFHVLHRDIKPDNTIIDKNGDAKLLDMGIAKTFSPGETITGTNVTVGTPYYMSPEQITGEDLLDARSDIYSLGITLYQLLTATLPFWGKTTGAIFQKHLTADFPSARVKNPMLSKQCDALLNIMMSKEKEHRQSCWEDVISDIDSVLNKKYPSTRNGALGKTKKSAAILNIAILAIAAVVVAILAMAFLLLPNNNKDSLQAHSTEKADKKIVEISKKAVPVVSSNTTIKAKADKKIAENPKKAVPAVSSNTTIKAKADKKIAESPKKAVPAVSSNTTIKEKADKKIVEIPKKAIPAVSSNTTIKEKADKKIVEIPKKAVKQKSIVKKIVSKEWDFSNPITVAILPFNERGSGVKTVGLQIADLIFADLVMNNKIWIVERTEMKKILDEAELNLSGMVNPAQANKIGQLSGAKIIVTGSVFKIKKKIIIVAKIISTETGKLLGAKVQGTWAIDKLVAGLSRKISDNINRKSKSLLPKVKTRTDIVTSLKRKMHGKKRPKLYISISEKHIDKPTPDPAAEVEMQLIAQLLGFKLTENQSDADLILTGEGFSEFSTRRRKLISVKARLEIKAVNHNGDVVAVDRQTSVEVDLAERIAGKKALQSASAKIAERLLPKLCK